VVELTALDAQGLLRALQDSAEHLSLGIVVVQISEPEQIVYVSESAAAILGRPRAEIEGGSPFAVLAPEAQEKARQLLEARGRGIAPAILLETVAVRPDGKRVAIEMGMSRIVSAASTLTVMFMRDITARKEAIETLRRSEERFRRVVEGAPDGVVILKQGRIVFMNQLGAKLLDLPDPKAGLGTLIADHLTPESAALARERIGRMMQTGVQLEPMDYHPKCNPERVIEIHSILIDREGEPAVLAFARDNSARRRIERELVRADRLASIGMLSAAVAHEINNPLAYVQLALQYLERELPTLVTGEHRAKVLEQVSNAMHGLERVATIVRDLRAYARADDGEIGRVDAVACIEQAIKLVDSDIRHRARLVREFKEVPAVEANASRLEQVFVNVLINAAQAIPTSDPTQHEIRISISQIGTNIAIAISDTGAGITAELKERAFEPFFTTKEIGVGTGLGLAVCRSIVEQLGGKITLDAGATRGAVVTITLPIYRGAAAATTAPAATAAKPHRRLRVLVVDDEPLVRRALTTVLGREHDVVVAEHGRQALDMLAGVDAILCDVMMPVMSGKDLYEHLAANEPALARRFIFITGGTLGPLTKFLEQTTVPILYKPFEVGQVLEMVAAAADR
jgi:PAS domain S-box-containing protein